MTYLTTIGVIVTNPALMILNFAKIGSSGINNPLRNAVKPVWTIQMPWPPCYVVAMKCQNFLYRRKASKSS